MDIEHELRVRIAEMLAHIHRRITDMQLDLSKLTDAVNKVASDADQLLTVQGTATAQLAADQAAVDALVPTVTAISTKIEAALAPPAPPTLPAS